MQYFKGDETELKFYASAEPVMSALSAQKDAFFDGAYSCFLLGELLYDNERAPLSKAIKRSIFRESFATIFDAFTEAGSFESYLTVFRNIFGDDVSVEFTVPAPGKLQIDIEAAGFALDDFITRYIVDNEYIFDEILEEIPGDNIAFQTIKGFTSQYELEQMLYEMVPAGIYTEISLTVGS
jgi:hypothetical protein